MAVLTKVWHYGSSRTGRLGDSFHPRFSEPTHGYKTHEPSETIHCAARVYFTLFGHVSTLPFLQIHIPRSTIEWLAAY
jgi:hypothetical protein